MLRALRREAFEMTDWRKIGERLGRAVAALVPESAKKRVRASYVEKYGKCRRCEAPLSGPSPEQICETCHPDELLDRAAGGKEAGDA